MANSEKLRINSAHNLIWYLEKNTSNKNPEWRDLIIYFFFNLYEILNKNYSIDVELKLVDGIDIMYKNQLVCYMHIRENHILLHMRESSLLYNHELTQKFTNKHIGSWPEMFKLKTKDEINEILNYLKRLEVTTEVEYYSNRRIPAKVQALVFDRDKGKCTSCHSTSNLHFDHIIPFSKGGSSSEVKISKFYVRNVIYKKEIENSYNYFLRFANFCSSNQ